MRFASIAFLLGSLSVASAHFQLQFPTPRGVFVEDDEPTFCDGYTTAATNRTTFPLTGGFFSLNSEHPTWTVGVIVSTAQNPSSFNNFSQAVPFFETTGEGVFCFPIDLATSGVNGIADGVNATLQIVFDGGDDKLYQCADVTLSSTATISSSVSCTNATGTGSSSASSSASGTSTASSTSVSPSATGANNGALANSVASGAALLSVVAAFAAML
ncbi:hypothetical protein QCA50_001620 [Cerrena zonata]|uniref:Copper acquisition factor BIM1-like domain-containing protein n=1 Tax=Cerrena zonata TaxID=2478898 RepID=A0AAW0GXK2_9APHY